MAESGDLHDDVADHTAKTLEDGQTEGEMKLRSVIDREEPHKDRFGLGLSEKQTGEGDENKTERSMGLTEELANLEGRSPCGDSAEVSLNNESPGLSKMNSSSEHLEEEQKESPSNCKKKRRPNKHKGGRRRTRNKPYHKMNLDEKQSKKRSVQFANGQPMAPYNTTQFLMADHQQYSPHELPHEPRNMDPDDKYRTGSDDDSNSPNYMPTKDYSSDEEYNVRIVQDFKEEYQMYHADRLRKLSKDDLVKEFIQLEARNEELEEKLEQTVNAKVQEQLGDVDLDNCDLPTLKSKFMEIVKKMTEQNAKLERENEFLKGACGKLQV